jgi:Uma2 family endonuclease
MTAFTVSLEPVLRLTDKQFFQLCQANPEIKFELTATGELIIMPPTDGETGERNHSLSGQLWQWNQQTKLGKGFDSSTCFNFPNGAERSPDASWIKLERWQALTPEQRQKFPPLAPDFVVELRSPTDRLPILQKKMQEYSENGVRLGWLINPQDQQVEIYRLGQEVEILQAPTHLSGEDVLPGFMLDLSQILTS